MKLYRLIALFLLALLLSAGLAYADWEETAVFPPLECCNDWMLYYLGLCFPPGWFC